MRLLMIVANGEPTKSLSSMIPVSGTRPTVVRTPGTRDADVLGYSVQWGRREEQMIRQTRGTKASSTAFKSNNGASALIKPVDRHECIRRRQLGRQPSSMYKNLVIQKMKTAFEGGLLVIMAPCL